MNLRLFRVVYKPHPGERSFLERTAVQTDNDFVIRVAVLDDHESERFFGVPLARKGIQPVWIQITNRGKQPYRLRLASLDPNYYPPLEAAHICHFAIGKRLLGFGLLAWLFFPLMLLLIFKVLSAHSANRRINVYFQDHGISAGLIGPGGELAGFVFATHDAGTKQVRVQLLGAPGVKEFLFSIPIPGLKLDYEHKRFDALLEHATVIDCDREELTRRLASMPRCTANRRGTGEGDPLNLVVVGEFAGILQAFGARWDETETIDLGSCWRMFKAFLLASRYRYSPVSALYVAGRSQDFALQKARQTINQRLHLRLWITPLRFEGKPVWIGQVSRDIGVRFTPRTWNLTTHRISANVDEARDYVLDDLMEAGRVAQVAYVAGAGECPPATPRRNLTGDPYFTNGLRALIVIAETRTEPVFW